MQTITTDTIEFLSNEQLRDRLDKAIMKHADIEFSDEPWRVPIEAQKRKNAVNETLAVMNGYDDSQRVMIIAYLDYFGGAQ